jgi:type I restriction enzyme R subunit
MTSGSSTLFPEGTVHHRDFSEDAAVEGPAAELFQSLGWSHANLYQEFSGESLEGRRTMREAVLPKRLWAALQKLNPTLSPEALNEAAAEITRDRSAMLPTDANAEIYRLLKDGSPVHVQGPDGERKTEIARVIDWRDARANDFLIAQQVWFQGELYKRRADLVGFVNGLPLLLIELKGPGENVKDAFDNNIRSYRADIPQVFTYNATIMVSNGMETKVGATHAPYEHFIDWKKAESEDEAPAAGLEVAIKGIGMPERLLDLIENFVAYERGKGGLTKKLAKNHQFLGVNRAVAAVDRIAQTRGRLGVFWHTQGSGKSLSMLYFAQKVLRTKPGNWTFVIVTDRLELDRQIADTFINCAATTKEREEIQAQNREHLKELLQGNERYVFTLIQKFGTAAGETLPMLSDRSDIIVITDEAHRSQYAVLAANMRRALPNAAFIAFTGTPLIATDAEKTKEVFGDYVSIYDFAQSIEDGATVPLYYENRIPELQLANDDLSDELDRVIDDADLDEAQEARLSQIFSRQYHLITRDDRLDKIADDVVHHFAGRGYRGKAMYIAIDKATALRMYDKVQARWKAEIRTMEAGLARLPDDERAGVEAKIGWMKATDMAVIVSAGQNEQSDMAAKGLDITPHRKRMNDEDMETKFKEPDDPFRLVFVCAMWLTGFDAPSCSTIYLDKPMKNHSLMQTIARANRVCGDKEAGLIVDYVGVFRNLQRALAIYARGMASGEMPIKDKAALLGELAKALNATKEFAGRRGVDSAAIIAKAGLSRLKAVADATEALVGTDAEKQTYLRLEGYAWKLYKAALPDPRVAPLTADMAVFHVLADRLRALTPKPDVSSVLGAIDDLLDESILGHAIRVPIRDPDDYTGLFDLRSIDFDKLSAAFRKGQQKTKVQLLRANVEQKITAMVRQNPTRTDFLEKFQNMIAEYNAGSATVEQLFQQLVDFIHSMSHEERRAAREEMSEEELAIFDLLTKPEPKLSRAQEIEVKRIARTMLAKLKHEKLVLDWRLKENAKADVRQTIREEFDALPEVYDRRIWEEKVERTFQFVYERYPSAVAMEQVRA